MQLNAAQKRLMERVINVFETSSPDGDYSNISIYHDGPHDIRQITYGRSQTTEYGNLRTLVHDYVNAGGQFSQQLQPYADKVGSSPLTDNAEFKNLLRRAGRDEGWSLLDLHRFQKLPRLLLSWLQREPLPSHNPPQSTVQKRALFPTTAHLISSINVRARSSS